MICALYLAKSQSEIAGNLIQRRTPERVPAVTNKGVDLCIFVWYFYFISHNLNYINDNFLRIG